MANLLKLTSITLLILAGGLKSSCQNFRHHITIPFFTLQTTNIPEFRYDISSSYVNSFYLPNIKYTLEYNRFIFGLEHYNYYKYIGYEEEVEGAITGLNIYSYSVFSGLKCRFHKLNLNLGLGLTYINHYIASYTDGFPQWFEDRPCYEFSKLRGLSFISIDRHIYKNITIGINLRYSPMFGPFSDKDFGYGTCISPHNHDRLNFANLQMFIGYRIGGNNQ